VGLQYHWQNPGYESFDDFLATLTSRKRKAIKRERRKALESGVQIRALTGAALEPRHWDAFHDFYLANADRKWGRPYLNREFFHLLGERLADKVVLILAEWDGQPVAGALNLVGTEALYGRNWGCLAHFRFLHFEACYYQAIDFAIRHGLKRVEAGAQGEHKIQRGYLPVETHSAQRPLDPRPGLPGRGGSVRRQGTPRGAPGDRGPGRLRTVPKDRHDPLENPA
jgi:predicted N-acyltransferase